MAGVQTRSRTTRLLGLLVACVLVAGLSLSMRQGTLLSQARRVPVDLLGAGAAGHFELLPRAGNWPSSRSWMGLQMLAGPTTRLVQVEDETGSVTTLAEAKLGDVASDFLLSPDRQHLFFRGHGVTDRSLRPLKGCWGLKEQWAAYMGGSYSWTPDSKSVIRLDHDRRPTATTVDVERLHVADKPGSWDQLVVQSPRIPSVAGPALPDQIVGFDSREQMIASTWQPEQVIDIEMVSFPLKAGAVARTWTIKIPPDSRVDELVLSPSGDRLLWKLRFTRESRFDLLLYRLFHREPAHHVSDEIWVSGLDGGGFRQIGSIPDPPDRRDRSIWHISWSPDGKRAFFQFTQEDLVPALYSVAIPD